MSRITGSEKDVKDLMDAGCDMVAIDGTFRQREGMTGPEFIKTMKQKYNVLIMADIATFEEGRACAEGRCRLSFHNPERLYTGNFRNDLSFSRP
jgi:putative N-acetylmannosamine-6-phosphate epimerase